MRRFFALLFLKIISLVIGCFFHLLYKIWIYFKSSKQRGAITLFVLSVHFSLIIYFLFHGQSFAAQRRAHPIAVRLVKEEKPIIKATAPAPETPKPTVAAVKKNNPAIKKQPPAPTKKVKAAPQKKQILKEIEKTLQKAEERPPAPALEPTPPQAPSYQQLLVEFLTEELSLPEPGEIKVKLLISFDGKIKNCEILSTNSRENELYLQKMLELIQFPKMEAMLISKEELEFLITFKGE